MKKALIILGGGISADGQLSARTQERVSKALELLKTEDFDYIILSGKYSFLSDFIPVATEAKAMRDLLLKKGISSNTILLEEDSTDTLGNAYFTKTNHIKPLNIEQITTITSDFSNERTKYVFEKVFGNEFNMKFISAKSTISEKESSEIEKLETKIFEITVEWLGPISNDEELRDLLFEKHPGYSKNPTVTKKDLLRSLAG